MNLHLVDQSAPTFSLNPDQALCLTELLQLSILSLSLSRSSPSPDLTRCLDSIRIRIQYLCLQENNPDLNRKASQIILEARAHHLIPSSSRSSTLSVTRL